MLFRRIALLVALLGVIALPASAQRRYDNGRNAPSHYQAKYDGNFAFVRLFYDRYPGWSFDYPDMELNMMSILSKISNTQTTPEGRNILHMDDPAIFNYPIAYISEPGYWFPSDNDVKNLRDYVAKGGFLIIDDFHYDNEWAVFEQAIKRVLPDGKIVPLDVKHPIYNTFFQVPSLRIPYPGNRGGPLFGEFYGIYQDNDPKKSLQVVINYNMDLGDYMEYSGSGFYLVDPSNEAFKLMINYIVYGHTR